MIGGTGGSGARDPIACVLFDFDFTLGDSSEAIVLSVNAGLAAAGLPDRASAEVLRTVGYPLRKKFEMLAPPDAHGRLDTFERAFHAEAARVMHSMTRLYDGAIDLLGVLRERGLRTGVVSTKHRVHLVKILTHLGALELLDTVVGGDEVGRNKPDPEGLVIAASRVGVEPARCCYVGDHKVDDEAARAAGMGFILMDGTRSDFASRESVPEAANRIRCLRELPTMLGLSAPRS